MFKMTKLFIFIILFSYCNIIYSQYTISGTVKDLDGNYLDKVNVRLTPMDLNTITNSNGTFTLTDIPSGEYFISFSHLGFKTANQSIKLMQDELNLSIVLENDLLNLKTIVVTGTFDPRTPFDSNTSTSQLQSEALQQFYPQGTASLLQNIPGTFTDASAGEVYTKVYTRGVSASAEDDMGWYYVSLQEDGLPVSLVQHSYYSPDLFHRMDLTVKKVEAIRGGSSSITALNAPGGIYNFMSHDVRNSFGGDIQFSGGAQGNDNFLYRVDGNIGSPLGNHWFMNAGGHYRKDDGARNIDFTFSKGGQFKFNVVKKYERGHLKFYGKWLDDYTNRWTGVAATNWDNPTPAFGQNFSSTSLLMPGYEASIPDARHLDKSKSNAFDPSKGVHARDLAFGVDFLQDFGDNLTVTNRFKFSSKNANWQTSISNAYVSLSDPTAYFVSGADFPIGQVVFKDARTGMELARVDNSGILAGQSAQYLGNGTLPNDAIMGTSAWYKDMAADEWMNQLTVRKQFTSHDMTTGLTLGFSNPSLFTQGSFAYVTYEPNPKMLQVSLENPGAPEIQLSDSNGVSNYGGLFFVNANAKVSQFATFLNDRWTLSKTIRLDLGLRYETIKHNGDKDRYSPYSQDGGLDGNRNTAYDNSILVPTGEKDKFDYTYKYLAFSGGINYRLHENAALFGRFSKGHKAPELNYYFNNFDNIPINEKGQIQNISQLEIGVKYSNKAVSFTSTLFWSELKNIGISNFEYDQDNNTIFYTPILFNTSRTFGLEWESAYQPAPHFSFHFNGIIQNPKASTWNIYDAAGTTETDDDTIINYSGNVLPFNPKIMFNLSGNYTSHTLSAFLKWQFMGNRYGNVSNGFELSSYSVFNAGTGYKISNHISASLIVNNLFNSKGLANFFGANAFGANANGATPEFIAANPETSFVVFPVLQRSALLKINYKI